MNIRAWLQRHSLKLLAIRDTPEAIAGGIAIGIYFGFAPVFGLKTLLSMLFAWLTGSNILAAVIAGTLHEIILPVMPVVYRWEYDVGYWLLSDPHAWPPSLTRFHLDRLSWRVWSAFLSVGKPLLLGGCLCPLPLSVLSYIISKRIVIRHQRKKLAEAAPARPEEDANPS